MLKKGEAAVARSEKQLTIIYDEDSIMERLDAGVMMIDLVSDDSLSLCRRDRKFGSHAVKQGETIHLLMPPNGLRVLKKKRRLVDFCFQFLV